MKVLSKTCSFACLGLFLAAFSVRILGEKPPSDSFSAAMVNMSRSLFPLVCGRLEQPGERFTALYTVGTGVFIDTAGHFITAGHVIREKFSTSPDQPAECLPAIYIAKSGWQPGAQSFDANWFKFGDCIRDPNVDVAVCRAQGNPFDAALRISAARLAKNAPDPGTPVAFTGFPAQTRQPVTTRSRIVRLEAAGKMDLWVLSPEVSDQPPWPGSSGSPVYLSDGSLIGIILRRGIQSDNGLAFALSSDSIHAFLAEHHLASRPARPAR
jgi:S1-C subfamily serine protease